jgi:hypothetical protein
MSLYNSLFGVNEFAPELMSMLGLNVPPDKQIDKTVDYNKFLKTCQAKNIWPIGRFRDAYVDRDSSSKLSIWVYTRNGGGNRPNYETVFDALKHHPNYIADMDDTLDSTYCYFQFSVPDKFKDRCVEILEIQGKVKNIKEKFEALLDKDFQDRSDPEVKNAIDVGFKILNQIPKTADSGSPNIITI